MIYLKYFIHFDKHISKFDKGTKGKNNTRTPKVIILYTLCTKNFCKMKHSLLVLLVILLNF
jgi:hypothetical protein